MHAETDILCVTPRALRTAPDCVTRLPLSEFSKRDLEQTSVLRLSHREQTIGQAALIDSNTFWRIRSALRPKHGGQGSVRPWDWTPGCSMPSRSLAAPQAGQKHEVLDPATATAGSAFNDPSAARKR